MIQIYKIALEYSRVIALKMGVSHISSEQRLRDLAYCKILLKKTPTDYDIAYASGLIHDNVTRIAWLMQYQKKSLDDIRDGDFLVLPPESESILLPSALADILDTFPNATASFCPKQFPETYEFSMNDLYIFHCAISSATCRLMEYLEIPYP